MPNYGDVALNLPASWSRPSFASNLFMLASIGHTAGTAEVHLTKEPDAEHAFAWVDPKSTDVFVRKMEGWQFVMKDDWTSTILDSWDAENKLQFMDQRLMALPKERFLAAKKAEREQFALMHNNSENEAALAEAERQGIEVEDGTGRRLTKATKRR